MVSSTDAGPRGNEPSFQMRLDPDRGRRRDLRRKRALATGLLVAMGVIYAATFFAEEPGLAILFLRAGAEAGVVGGLADWFAVTALFRRPLGLPIPHTAIIPRSKERIGQALRRFVEDNLLTRSVVLRRVRQARFGRRLADALATAATAAALARWVTAIAPALVQAADNPKLRQLATGAAINPLMRADISPAVKRVLRGLADSGETDALCDVAIEQALRWLDENKERVHSIVREKSRWWIPKGIDRQIAATVLDALTELLRDLEDPEGEARMQFRASLNAFIEELTETAHGRARINAAKERFLSNPEVRAWFAALWREFAQSALFDLERPSPAFQHALEEQLLTIGQALSPDETVVAQLDLAAERMALLLLQRRRELGSVIAEVIRNWDTRT